MSGSRHTNPLFVLVTRMSKRRVRRQLSTGPATVVPDGLLPEGEDAWPRPWTEARQLHHSEAYTPLYLLSPLRCLLLWPGSLFLRCLLLYRSHPLLRGRLLRCPEVPKE